MKFTIKSIQKVKKNTVFINYFLKFKLKEIISLFCTIISSTNWILINLKQMHIFHLNSKQKFKNKIDHNGIKIVLYLNFFIKII